MVPLEVRELPPDQYEIFSLYCDKVAYTTEPGEPEPRAQDDGTIHIGSGRDLQIFMPDVPGYTDCSMYGTVPVTVTDNLDGTFEVYSNVCEFNIFKSQPKSGPPDSYEWNGDVLVVLEQELDMIDLTEFPPETEHQDCFAYDNVDDPIIGILTSPVELIKFKDGSFDVWSHMCDMSIWDYQEGDTYRWNGDVLEIKRTDGDDKSRFRFEPESPGVDCEAYEANLDPAKPE